MMEENSYCCDPKPKKHVFLKLILLAAGAASIVYLKSKKKPCSQEDEGCDCCTTTHPDSDSPGAYGAVGDETPAVTAADFVDDGTIADN